MNVLHYGLILNQPYEITRGLRKIGVSADYALWDDCGQGWLIRDWDINLNMEKLSFFEKRRVYNRFLQKVLDEYDIIHFHSHPTLWYTNFLNTKYDDTKMLKANDKKMFISVWGCEARQWEKDIKFMWSPCSNCIGKQEYCGACSNRVLAASRKYCQSIFSTGDICVANPDILWSNIAIDTEELNPTVLKTPKKYEIDRSCDELLIYHSFANSGNRHDVKGSGYIKKTIDRLKKDGYKIEYVFIDDVPNADIKYIQVQSDIVIEQICAGWHGVTAVECMSLAKPVLVYLRDACIKACPNKDIPLINTNPNTLKQNLITLIENKECFPEIGKKSREYAIKYHDHKVVAESFAKHYRC